MVWSAWQKIDVPASRPYSIYLGAPLEELGGYLPRIANGIQHILVITHPIVERIYGERLRKGLQGFDVDFIIVPEGEEEKSLSRLDWLTQEAVRCGATRQTVVIALGGGVIGDLAGFFASTFMRGIRYLQVPTTLLAQVDSSIGGKVAVNHAAGKNLLGAFYPPLAVWADFSTLESLPWKEIQNGLAESIKHALIADREFFQFFSTYHKELMARDPCIYQEMATRSLGIKVKIVSADEREQGLRALLNLGHSFGHALEKAMDYRGITHGEAVSIGLVAAAWLAHWRNMVSENEVSAIIETIASFGLPTKTLVQDVTKLLGHMSSDKKNVRGQKVLILPKGIGQALVVKDCRDEEILRAWHQVMRK